MARLITGPLIAGPTSEGRTRIREPLALGGLQTPIQERFDRPRGGVDAVDPGIDPAPDRVIEVEIRHPMRDTSRIDAPVEVLGPGPGRSDGVPGSGDRAWQQSGHRRDVIR